MSRGQRMDLFTCQRRTVRSGGADTLDRQGRILPEDLVLAQAAYQAVEDDADGDTGAANTGLATDHVGVRDDEGSLGIGHGPTVGPRVRVDDGGCG
jgi:hypothetical protein